MSRNAYINQALDFFNKMNHRKLLRKKLKNELGLVNASSIEVLKEFEKSDILVDQIRAIDNNLLQKKIGKLNLREKDKLISNLQILIFE